MENKMEIKPINERSPSSPSVRLLKRLLKNDRINKWIHEKTVIVSPKFSVAWWFYKANDKNEGKVISYFTLKECNKIKKFNLIEDGDNTYYEPDFTNELKKIMNKRK
jgi:hypothetical protein